MCLILVWKVLANFAVLLALFSGHVVQCIFFGSLRPNEIEVCLNSFIYHFLSFNVC